MRLGRNWIESKNKEIENCSTEPARVRHLAHALPFVMLISETTEEKRDFSP